MQEAVISHEVSLNFEIRCPIVASIFQHCRYRPWFLNGADVAYQIAGSEHL